MFKLETINELYLRATCLDGQGELFTKAGAWVAGQGEYHFEKVLLGPQNNPIQAIMGQIGRRLTGENLPLMKVTPKGQSQTMYAESAKHVTVIPLQQGMSLKVESEDLLAFTDCDYGFTILAQGVISQKGFFTSELKAKGPNAQVAVLTDGNPMVISTPCMVDPDCINCWTGQNPGFKLDLSWKNLIGQASGESYMFEFKQSGGQVIIQPNERKSGLHLGIDDNNYTPDIQQNQTFGGAFSDMGQAGQAIQGMLGGILGNGRR